MAKKKSKPPAPLASVPPPDQPMMQDLLRLMLGEAGPPAESALEGDFPAERAAALVRQAEAAPDAKAAIAQGRRATEIDPDCVAAHVLLGDLARTPKEALAHYEAGTDAGVRVLGPRVFSDADGDLWQHLEARPYLRARLGLAESLLAIGRRDEAIGHYEELLLLNPGDHQGVRYHLAPALAELGRDGALANLLRRYESDSMAGWAFTGALLAYRQSGDSPASRRALKLAAGMNRHVIPFLAGERLIPSALPSSFLAGDESEAIHYVAGNQRAWRATPGALEWVRVANARRKPKTTAKASAKSKAKAKSRAKTRTQTPPPTGPLPFVKERLKRVPRLDDETWQADARPLGLSFMEAANPWLLMIASRNDGLVLGQEIFPTRPSPEALWDKLAQAIEFPMADEAHRPAVLQFRHGIGWEFLVEHCEELEITSVELGGLDLLDGLFESLLATLPLDGGLPGLVDVDGLSLEAVGSFFSAAAAYHRAAPWRKFAGEETLEVRCERLADGPRYAVVMGQMGMTLGLALYDDFRLLAEIRDSDAPDHETVERTVALSVTYDEERDAAPGDVEHARRFGWEVDGPEAFPTVIRKEFGQVMRPPRPVELTLLDACLRAIPRFLDEHADREPTPVILNVPTGDGDATLSLRWVDPSEADRA